MILFVGERRAGPPAASQLQGLIKTAIHEFLQQQDRRIPQDSTREIVGIEMHARTSACSAAARTRFAREFRSKREFVTTTRIWTR
jgi:hypothetical protein